MKGASLWTVAAMLFLLMPSRFAGAAPTTTAGLPPLQTQGDIAYLSGGIGSDEAEAIRAVRDQYTLSVSLSARADGHDVYLATVPLTIRDAAGEIVLDVVSDGPYLLAQLPAGRYEIAARYDGEEKKAGVVIADGRPQRVALNWPQLAAGSVPAVPASENVDAGTASVAAALPPVNTQGGIPYLSGGIGSEEVAAIKAAASHYSLAVTLSASEEGHAVFLASVPLTVRDQSGVTLLDLVSDGPYLLADLPPGRYVVRARYADQDKTATVTVAPGRTAHVSFNWAAAAP